MAELVAWFLLLGVAITIAGIWMLSSQIKKYTKDMAEIILLVVSELKRLTSPAAQPVEPVGVILERRCAHRRAQRVPTSERGGYAEKRRSPGRRREDLTVVRNAG